MTCEDFPCCGHERGDCDGSLYGSDESIMAAEVRRIQAAEYQGYYDDDEV